MSVSVPVCACVLCAIRNGAGLGYPGVRVVGGGISVSVWLRSHGGGGGGSSGPARGAELVWDSGRGHHLIHPRQPLT